MKKAIVVCVSISVALMGCATSSKNIATSYISPLQYQSYDCDQLAGEIQRVQVRASQLGGTLDKAATNDKWVMAGGLILFWPVLFALGGTSNQEAEYARLKGEHDAIAQSAVIKKCPGVVVQSAPSPATDKPAEIVQNP
ncbi:MAG: hypothetical protein NTW90_02345 [Nitrosospira sp.]|nr:hypothetical protein [Nitrosospira sp.]